ncbi:adenylosuccinate lyase family protein, partial [Thioclava sp. BHET1]
MALTDTADPAPLTSAEARALFTPRALRSTWLEIEAALAETQAELGMIPAEAAQAIRAVASFDVIDAEALERDIARTRAPIVSLVRAMAEAAGDPAGGYVHWGATTQNVVQTARTLAMKRAHGSFLVRFDRVLGQLADMAEREAQTLTVARTNQRHALPVTWGFKVAAWIEELLRHRARLTEATPRVFCAQWGGAVGAMQASGADGPELNVRISARLGLGHMRVPSRAAQDT